MYLQKKLFKLYFRSSQIAGSSETESTTFFLSCHSSATGSQISQVTEPKQKKYNNFLLSLTHSSVIQGPAKDPARQRNKKSHSSIQSETDAYIFWPVYIQFSLLSCFFHVLSTSSISLTQREHTATSLFPHKFDLQLVYTKDLSFVFSLLDKWQSCLFSIFTPKLFNQDWGPEAVTSI